LRVAYNCAYLGDGLIQGYLYITPNHFCFYSKLLGRQRHVCLLFSW